MFLKCATFFKKTKLGNRGRPMAFLEFKDSYRTGHDSVDHEHEELIGLINDLHSTLGNSGEKEKVEEILGEMHGQISSHFALEEKVMRDQHYEDYAAHSRDHNRLLDEILDIMDRVHNDGSYEYMERLEKEVADWFEVHFREMDGKFHGKISNTEVTAQGEVGY